MLDVGTMTGLAGLFGERERREEGRGRQGGRQGRVRGMERELGVEKRRMGRFDEADDRFRNGAGDASEGHACMHAGHVPGFAFWRFECGPGQG